MTNNLRKPQEPFWDFVRTARQIVSFWARFTGSVVAICLVFGPLAPLAGVAFLFTLGLPILLLVLWGKALDLELRWGEREREPW